MSTFSKVAANIVRQIDPDGCLIPVSRINDADKLVPKAIVVRQGRRWWWQRPKYKYQPHSFKLSDILLGESTLSPGVDEIDLLSYGGRFEEGFSTKVGAKVGLAFGQVQGTSTNQLQSDLGMLKKQKVDVKQLLRDYKNRSVDLQHMLVKQLKHGHVLAVLTERIITTSACCVSEQRSCKGLLGLMVNTMTVCVKNNAKFQKACQESIEIPEGTVIAYSVKELEINKENGDFEICLHDGIESDCVFEEDGLIPDKTPELHNPQVFLSPLAEIPLLTRSALFQRFCEVMKDRDALSDVENTLQEWCTGDASVYQSNSASAILDLLRPYLLRTDTDSHIESDGPGSAGTLGSPLTAVHLLVSAMEALPDEALSLLSESSPDVLKAFNDLLNMSELKKKSCSSIPLESLPLPLQDDKAFHWMQQLLITSNVNLRREAGELSAERESNAGVLPLVLCVTVQGLAYLCDQQE